MKKLIALMLVLVLCLFAGCTNETSSEQKEDIKEKKESTAELTKGSYEKNTKEDTEFEEEKDEPAESNMVKIDGSWLALMGKTSSEIADIKGAMSENLWADGPLYRFGPENVWYGFENYDFASDNSYIPIGGCTDIGVPLSLLLKTDGAYNADSLEEAMGKVLTQGFDVMYECNTYSAVYNGCRLVIYENSREDINADSVVNIEEA